MKNALRALFVMVLLAGPVLAADSLTPAKTPIRTINKNDIQTQATGQDGTTVLQISVDNTALGGASIGAAFVLPAIAKSTTPTTTDGNAVMLWTDTTRRLYVRTDSAQPLDSNLTKIAGTAVSVNAGAADNGTQRVVLATGGATVPVTSGAPSGAASAVQNVTAGSPSSTNIGTGVTTAVVCKGSLAVSQPLKLYKAVVAGAALARCNIRYNDNGTFTNWGSVVVSPTLPSFAYDCPGGFCSLTTSATSTVQQIEANCTNFDTAAQDFSCSVQYCQSASGC